MSVTALAKSTTAALRSARRGGVFYGWWIVAAGIGIQGLVNALFTQAYGAYVVLLRDEFGWSKTMLSSAFSMAQAESGVTGPLQGWLTDRFGPRAIIRAGLVILGAGFMLLSRVNSPVTFFAAFFVISAGVSLAGYLSITIAVVNWFERRRATALGLVTAGGAIGGMLVPATVWALESWGWRTTAFASGVLVIAVGLPLVQCLRHRPEDHGLAIDGAASHGLRTQAALTTTAGEDRAYTVSEAVRTPQFWFISFGHGAALLIVSAVTVHLVAHIHDNLGYSLTMAGFVVTVLTFAQVVGTLAGGYFGDRLNKRWIATGCMFAHAGALLVLAYATALWMVFAFAVAHGLAWGTRGPLMAAIRADYFGRAAFGAILGASQPIVMVGMTGGPILAGVLADRTGNYEAGFTVLAALAAMGSIFFVLSPRPAPRH